MKHSKHTIKCDTFGDITPFLSPPFPPPLLFLHHRSQLLPFRPARVRERGCPPPNRSITAAAAGRRGLEMGKFAIARKMEKNNICFLVKDTCKKMFLLK